jgi:hypothetical protein
LHHRYLINEKINMKNTLFYVHGKGFYKQLKEDENLWRHGLAEEPGPKADLVRRKLVEKDHIGWISNVNWLHSKGELTGGTYISYFASDHWGVVDSLSISHPSFQPNFRYYQYLGDKRYATFF